MNELEKTIEELLEEKFGYLLDEEEKHRILIEQEKDYEEGLL